VLLNDTTNELAGWLVHHTISLMLNIKQGSCEYLKAVFPLRFGVSVCAQKIGSFMSKLKMNQRVPNKNADLLEKKNQLNGNRAFKCFDLSRCGNRIQLDRLQVRYCNHY